MALISLNNPDHEPVNPKAPRYNRYRNAHEVGDNLYEAEIGMGLKPKVFRLGYLMEHDGRIMFRGWMTKRRNEEFSINWRVVDTEFYSPYVEGKGLTLEQAEYLLRRLAGVL